MPCGPQFSLSIRFYIQNNCSYAVWPAFLTHGGGRRLDTGETWTLDFQNGPMLTKIWARTNCTFNSTGQGKLPHPRLQRLAQLHHLQLAVADQGGVRPQGLLRQLRHGWLQRSDRDEAHHQQLQPLRQVRGGHRGTVPRQAEDGWRLQQPVHGVQDEEYCCCDGAVAVLLNLQTGKRWRREKREENMKKK